MTNWLYGYKSRKLISYAAAAGATANYVVFVKVYLGAGIDGSEALTGGHNGVVASKVYLKDNVAPNFNNVCFTDNTGTARLDFFKDTYTTNSSALFAVEVSADMSAASPFYVYWQGEDSSDKSSAANTFRRVISSGVVLALPMNEGSGATCTDYSGNSHNGTITDATWVTIGKFGTALNFDGAGNDKVNCGNTINPTAAASIVVWCNPDIVNNDSQISLVTKRDGVATRAWSVGISSAAKARFDFWDGLGASKARVCNTAIVQGSHNLLIATYDGVNGKYYLNNVNDGANFPFTGINDVVATAYVGFEVENGRVFDGRIGPVFIVDYALSTSEITDLSTYYPQCSTANLGSLYLRSYVYPEPQPSSIGTEEYAAPLTAIDYNRDMKRRLKQKQQRHAYESWITYLTYKITHPIILFLQKTIKF
jgi:hypothetical protein